MGEKNIVLILPPIATTDWTPREVGPLSPGVPMGLLSIGSILMENGYRVKILDGFLGKINLAAELDQVLKDMSQNKTLFVGISAMTTQLPSAFKAAAIIRGNFPDIPLVWGGMHPTLFPEETCADPLADAVVIGEGEYACLELAQAFSGARPLSTVKGIMFKGPDKKVIYTGLRNHTDLNELPFPRYELFDINDYLYRPMISGDSPREGKMTKLLHLHTGMGCPFRCTFCINTTIYRDGKYYQKSLYRGKSAARILDEIEILIDRYGVEHISFVDECFLVDKKRLFQLLDGIEERGLKFTWSTGGKVNYVNDNYISQDILKRMKGLGCVALGFGAESGSQRILDYLKKGITTEQVERAAEATNDNKIASEFSFMIGLPQESIEDMFKTVDFIRKLKKIGDYVMAQGAQLYRPYPGCELYDESLKLGFDAPRNIRDWTAGRLQEIGGFVKPEYLPWLKNDKRKTAVVKYVTAYLFLETGRKWESKVPFLWNCLRKAAYSILNGVFEIRRKLDFWAFPIECKPVEAIRSVKKFIVNKRKTTFKAGSDENVIKEKLLALKGLDANTYQYLMDKIEFSRLKRFKKTIRQAVKKYLAELTVKYKNRVSAKGLISYINLPSGKKKILYISAMITPNLVRQSIYLRRTKEFETILLTESPRFGNFTEKYFDAVYVYDSCYALANILKNVHPYLIHIFAYMLHTEHIAVLARFLSNCPLVTEFYDVASLSISKEDAVKVWGKADTELGFFSEKFACEKSDSLILGYSTKATEVLKSRYDIRGPILEFHSYICDDFLSQSNGKYSDIDGKDHIVHGGMVQPSRLPGKNFGDTQYHRLIETITTQGICFDIYLNPQYNFFRTKQLFRDYILMARNNPLFNFKMGVPLDEAPKEFSKYDFGAMISFLDKGKGLDDHIQARLATKFFTYLEAGLPIIVNEEFQYPAKLVKEYGIGIVVSQKDLNNISEVIKRCDKEELMANVKKAQKELSMDKHIERLVTFYEQVNRPRLPREVELCKT